MRYGVCADPQAAGALAAAGFDFIELNVQRHLQPLADEATFTETLRQIEAASLPAIAANSFYPGHLKITGLEVDWAALEAYARTAFARAQAAGVRTIVFGSGGAREIPEGFDRDLAWTQLVRFGKLLGPLAGAHNVTVVVEPLNRTRGECNVLNTVAESAALVNDVDHPNVRLLVDAYHWGLDRESPDTIVEHAHLVHHVHIATVQNRLAPGFEPADFSSFFHALREGGYDGPVSIESRWDDLEGQAATAYATLVGLARAAGY